MSDPYETAEERRARRKARKAERAIEARNDAVIQDMLRTPGGRAWTRELLEKCHVFHASFSINPYSTAFREGERNVGLILLQAIMHAAPEAYIQMMKEQGNAGSQQPLDRRNPDDDRNWDGAGRWIGDGDEPEADGDDE